MRTISALRLHELQPAYANSGSKACSIHSIDLDILENIILADIQYHAETAIQDEQGLLDRLLSFSGQERQNKNKNGHKALSIQVNYNFVGCLS